MKATLQQFLRRLAARRLLAAAALLALAACLAALVLLCCEPQELLWKCLTLLLAGLLLAMLVGRCLPGAEELREQACSPPSETAPLPEPPAGPPPAEVETDAAGSDANEQDEADEPAPAEPESAPEEAAATPPDTAAEAIPAPPAPPAQATHQDAYVEKMKNYATFIQNLCRTLQHGKADDDDIDRLLFDTATIAMHTSPEHLAAISENIAQLAHASNDISSTTAQRGAAKLDALFRMVSNFRRELHPAPVGTADEGQDSQAGATSPRPPSACPSPLVGNAMGAAIRNSFAEAFELLSSDENGRTERPTHALAPLKPAAEENRWVPTGICARALVRWKALGWNLEDVPGNAIEFRISKDGSDRQIIEIGFYDGHYYLQATYRESADFARAMKWEYRGRRAYESWWKPFDTPFYHLKRGEFREMLQWDKSLQQYLIERVDTILAHMQHQDETLAWLNATQARLQEQQGAADARWQLDTWYWGVFRCIYQDEEEGSPFLALYREKGEGAPVLELGNRARDESLLRATLKRIAASGKQRGSYRVELKRFTREPSHNELVTELLGWMERLAAHEDTEDSTAGPPPWRNIQPEEE